MRMRGRWRKRGMSLLGAQKIYVALNSIKRNEDREGWFMEKNKYWVVDLILGHF